MLLIAIVWSLCLTECEQKQRFGMAQISVLYQYKMINFTNVSFAILGDRNMIWLTGTLSLARRAISMVLLVSQSLLW